MKKIFLILIVFCFSAVMIFSQTITITKPGLNEELQKGSFYTIKWTSSGIADTQIKLHLHNLNSGRQYNIPSVYSANAPNSGKYRWQVPLKSTVEAGSFYTIFIKTSVKTFWSKKFKIVASQLKFKAKIITPTVKMASTKPDFDVIETYLTNNNELKTKIVNLGANWKGILYFKCTIGNRSFRFSDHYTFARNQVIEIKTPGVATIDDISCPNPKTLLVVKADPDNRIAEQNELNNIQSLMFKHNLPRPDYIVWNVFSINQLAPSESALKDKDSSYHVCVKNTGKSYRGRIFIKIIDTETNGNKLNLFVEKKDIYFYAGEEKCINVGLGPQLLFKKNGKVERINFRVRAEVISGQFNCELKSKRGNNSWEGFVQTNQTSQ